MSKNWRLRCDYNKIKRIVGEETRFIKRRTEKEDRKKSSISFKSRNGSRRKKLCGIKAFTMTRLARKCM